MLANIELILGNTDIFNELVRDGVCNVAAIKLLMLSKYISNTHNREETLTEAEEAQGQERHDDKVQPMHYFSQITKITQAQLDLLSLRFGFFLF